MTDSENIKSVMERYGIAPLKRYGQNFLTDSSIAQRIASYIPKGADAIEIGPGLGALTERLAERARSVAAYEIDRGLVRALKDLLASCPNVTVFHEDFIKADLENELSMIFTGDVYVAANLPYYITTDCIMKLLQAGLNIKRMVLMVQKEFAKRICAQPGDSEYGASAAAVGYFAAPRPVLSVPPSSFYPRPHISSSVLIIDINGYDREEADAYLKTVRALFSMRRKTVRSNLRHVFSLSAAEAQDLIIKAGIEPEVRAEKLRVQEIKNISNLLWNCEIIK